jgi:hypothetical protein
MLGKLDMSPATAVVFRVDGSGSFDFRVVSEILAIVHRCAPNCDARFHLIEAGPAISGWASDRSSEASKSSNEQSKIGTLQSIMQPIRRTSCTVGGPLATIRPLAMTPDSSCIERSAHGMVHAFAKL